MTTTTAEIILQKLTRFVCTHPKYAKSRHVTKAIYLGGAIAMQLGDIPVSLLRKRMMTFAIGDRQYKIRYNHRSGGVLEIVRLKGNRDGKIVRQIGSLHDAAGIMADLEK